MNIQEYISSGILEAYLLGALGSEEELLVEANIVKFPELAAELQAIEDAMQQFAETQAQAPPPGLEDKIWNAIKANDVKSNGAAEGQAARTIAFQPEYKRQPVQWKYAALWAGLAISLAGNMLLMNSNSRQKEQNVALNNKIDTIAEGQKQQALALQEYQKAKGMMADTAMQTIVMHTMQKGHPMAATVYWSKGKGDAYVSVDGMPEPPKGMQYQLWVMQGGKPVSMGVLPNAMANTPAMQKIAMQVTGGEAFAISLEKEGGSPTPTMQNIYVLGKA